MADQAQVQLIKEGVSRWNQWRLENSETKIDLSGSNLSGLRLVGVNLTGANLISVNLENANLTSAKLEKAKIISSHLVNANLRGAFLVEANLRDANLDSANLSAAYLTNAYFKKANLNQANLKGAFLNKTDLTRADLTQSDLSGAHLKEANLFKTILCKANLTGANLQNAILVETDISQAILTRCKVYGLSAWGLKGTPSEQSSIIITAENEMEVTVDDLQVAQFIYLILNRENIRNVINSISSKAILILGRFTPERKVVLDTMANESRKNGLLPIIFDFEGPSSKNFTETIKILAGMSLFIIVDITNPRSSPLELQAIVPDYEIPFVPIIQANERAFSMFEDLSKYSWMLPLTTYTSLEILQSGFKTVIIDRAWGKIKEIELRRSDRHKPKSFEDFIKERN